MVFVFSLFKQGKLLLVTGLALNLNSDAIIDAAKPK